MKNSAGDSAARGDVGARLMLVLLCLIWGITWPLMKIALLEIPPFSMRAASSALGALTLYLICVATRRSFRVPTATAWLHITVASLLNIVGFVVFSSFAQLGASTSRVVILAYTMPIWSVLLAWPFLGERPTRMQTVALLLCAAGLSVLIYPLTGNGIPRGILFALASGLSWAAGTVYLKWARIDADPMGVASWQMTIAFVALVICMLTFDGKLDLSRARADGLASMVWTGIVGNGVAYGLWFAIVRRLPAVAASLGVLAVPVVGIVMTFFILGDTPTTPDMIGFALILAASACVLLTPHSPPAPSPQIGSGVTP